MIKISLKKVYSQPELVADLMRAGELMEELEDCRIAECDGCEACYQLDEEVSVRELGYFMHHFHYYAVPSDDDYYAVAEIIKEMPADDFKTLSWLIGRSKKLDLWDLQKRRSWDSVARAKLELWEED